MEEICFMFLIMFLLLLKVLDDVNAGIEGLQDYKYIVLVVHVSDQQIHCLLNILVNILGGFLLSHGQQWLQSPSTQRAQTLLIYYILLEGHRARPPRPEPQLEDSYTGRLLTSSRDTVPYRA